MAINRSGKIVKNTGGTSARVSNVKEIPSLNTTVVKQYEESKPTYNRTLSPVQNLVRYAENMKTRQSLADEYNAVKNQQTADTLARLGQTNVARGSNSYAVEQAKQGRLMSGLVNSLMDNEKVGNITTFLAGTAPGVDYLRQRQADSMKGTLTDEMRSAGLTQEDIDRWNNQQNQIERQEVLSNYAKQHPVLATLNAFPENIAGSTEGNIEKVLNYLQGKPLESKPTNAEIYRSAVSEGINSKPGNFAYNVGNSIGDMLLAQVVTGGLGKGKVAAGLMGLEKSNPVMNSAIERGLTPTQILAEGVGSGLTTAATEAIPFGRFAEGGHILGSMLAEGAQEGAEDIADTLLDRLVTSVGGNSDRSEWNQNIQAYLDAGYTEEEAKKNALSNYLKQVGLDALAGLISGGVMQTGSNILNQRNLVTGKPKIAQLEEQTKVEEKSEQPKETPKQTEVAEEDKEAVEYLRDVLEEANQMEMHPENVRTQQTIPQVEQPTQNETIPQEVRNYVNNREQLVNYVTQNQPGYDEAQQIIRSINAMDEYMFQNYPEWMDGETGNFKREEYDRLNSMQAKPIQQAAQPVEQPTIPSLTNRQLAQYSRQIEGLKDKLNMFGNKSFNKSLDKALNAVQNTQGEAQQNAIASLNNLVNQVNETMNGEEIGVNARDFNKDSFNRIQEVTDGYKIKIDPKVLKNEYDVKGISDFNDRYMNTGSNNHIKLVAPDYKGKGGMSIDRVYDEIYSQNVGLEPANGRSEEDLLRSLVKFLNESKAGRDDTVMNSTWENVPITDNRTNVEVEADNRADELLDKISRGDITEEEYLDFVNFILDAGNGKDAKVQDALADTFSDVSTAWRNMPKSALPLDEDVQNIGTLEEALTMLNEELDSIPMNLDFFGRNNRGEVEANDPDRVQTGRYKTSEAYTNTAEKSGNLTDEQRRIVEANKSMLYQENSEKESIAEAEKRILEGGWQTEFERLINKESFNNVDTDELMMIWRHFKEQAISLDEKGLDSTNAWQKAVDCLTKIKAEGSKEGSALQALAKWSRNNTPEGLLAQAESIIEAAENGYAKNYEKTKDGWYKQINKLTKGKTRQMDVGFVKEFLTEANRLEGLDIDSVEAKHIMANLGKLVNTQIPVTLREKITTLLMDNMLGNFRTLITRNAGGNLGYNFVEQTLRKRLSAKIDKAISAKRGTSRTISENTKEGRSAYFEGAKEAIKQEIYDFQNNIHSARSGENTLNTAVTNNRDIYSNKHILGKLGNFYNKLVKAGLSAGDRPFFESVYKQYMTEYEQLYNDGKLKDMPREKFEELAKANAYLKALEAVYQDDSEIAQAFIGLKNSVNKLSEGVVGADILSQFTMPFVKTPANIIQRAIEYSPIGLIKNAIQTTRELKHSMTDNEIMDFDQERFATETARNIIGSVLFGVAVLLAKAGKMTGAYSEDKDMAQAQREAGMQEYALHNPLGLNMDVDISSIPVLGNDMVAAAAAYDAFRNNPELSVGERIGKGLTAGLQSQFETSALQGMQRLFGGSFNSGGDLLSNAVDTVKSGGTQLIPSLARQAAQFADPYRRQLTGANENDYYRNSIINSIPGLRQGLEPRISRTGKYMEQNPGRGTAAKFFDTFINPFNVSVGTEDAVRDEAMRLYEATGNNIAFQPGVTIKDLKTEDHIPTPEEFTQYQQNAYGAMNQIASQVIASDYYQNLSDGDKETLLDNIYKAVKSVEKANILGTDKSNLSGAAKAYNEGGAEGLINYCTAKSVLTEMGLDNNTKNREYILETLDNGGTEAVNEILQLSDELVNAGLTGSLTEQYAYNHAAQYIPSLTPTQFAKDYTDLNYDGQSGITQKDILAYVNQNPTAYSEEDMNRIWNAYGQSSWSKQPHWNGEQWSAK